jgi:hypothetical protein
VRRRLLHLLTAGYGTTRLCPDVRDHGEYWRVSGPVLGMPRERINILRCKQVPCLSAPTASDIEGATDLDWVGLGLETEISRCALDLCMAQERSNRLQIASALQNVESFRPA